jgi:hypothetical protein
MTDVFKLIEANGLTLHGDIEHFAALVAAAEREACARMVEDKFDFVGDELIIADAIRARGNT